MVRILICGGRHVGRVPSALPHEQINARIIRASKEQEQLAAALRELHTKVGIEVILHFNRRGAERLASHWASIVQIATKSLQTSSRAPIIHGREQCRQLLLAERVGLMLRFADPDADEFGEMEDAAASLNIEVRHIDPANILDTLLPAEASSGRRQG